MAADAHVGARPYLRLLGIPDAHVSVLHQYTSAKLQPAMTTQVRGANPSPSAAFVCDQRGRPCGPRGSPCDPRGSPWKLGESICLEANFDLFRIQN